jgi:glycosyltransferase involved in cell wall biosynthesis
MIHIAFISTLAYNHFFPGTARQAGGHTRIVNLAKKFANLPDYRVSCLVGDFGQPEETEIDGVRLIKAPIDRPHAILKVFKKLRSVKADVYIDFCASPRLMLLRLLKKTYKSKYIFLVGSDSDVTGEYRKIANNLYYYTYNSGLKHADAIICQTPKQVKLLREKYKLSSHCVLSPYFDIEQPKKKKKKENVLWVGRAATYKNPEAFISLAQKFPGERFVMICNESLYDKEFMKTLKTRLAALKNLKFFDYIEYPDIQKFFKSAKLLVNTSKFEGFPNTFIEAAMNYTPILSLNVDPNGMLSNFKAGVCCGGDTGQFFKAFKVLVSEEGKLGEYGENAYRYAEKYHQLDAAVEKIGWIIQGVLGRRNEGLGIRGL